MGNPFDPSLKADSSRINADSGEIPGMNPPAPEPSSQPGGSSSSKPGSGEGGSAGGPSGSGPDYAALLQYLQYYQKQLGPDEEPSDEGIMIMMNQTIDNLHLLCNRPVL